MKCFYLKYSPLTVCRWFLSMCLLMSAFQLQAELHFNCQAGFSFEPYDGQLPQPGGITFTNEASGSYTNISWNFGDDKFSSETTQTVTHFYSESGTFEVCLTIWDGQDCNSMICHDVTVNLSNGSCGLDDCVYPGDVNGDGVANLYDLIPLSGGIGATGPYRPNATLDFAPQQAEDWDLFTPEGINYKHLDCDGDGVVETEDFLAIQRNYSAIEDPIDVFESDGPEVYLEFETDTVYLDQNNIPDQVMIKAGIFLGDEAAPLENLHGMAMALSYDSTFVSTQGIHFEYNNNSFIGDAGIALPYSRKLGSEQQLDLGVARLNRRTAGGYGRVATVSFIIIGDLIDSRSSNQGKGIDFAVPIKSIRLVDGEGEEIEVAIRKLPAKVTFVKKTLTSTNNPLLDAKVAIFPNPAQNQLFIQLDGLQGERVELFDSMGKTIKVHPLNSNRNALDIHDIPSGLYTLKVLTKEGMVSKRFVKN